MSFWEVGEKFIGKCGGGAKRISELIYTPVKEWMNEWMNERMNEQINIKLYTESQ